MVEWKPLRYRGYVYDNETALYYLQSRYYDPAIGRFINGDVLISSAQGLVGNNVFAYCSNNPVVRLDRDGQFWDTVFDIISLGASVIDVCINPSDAWAWIGLAGDALDLIPFLTGVGEVIRVVKTADNVTDVVDTTYDIAKTVNSAENAIDASTDGIRYTDKVLKQMDNASDLHHSFPSIVDNFVDLDSGRPLKGGDGIVRKIIEIPGSINNTPGVFEYIIEPNGMCNHRYFRSVKQLNGH